MVKFVKPNLKEEIMVLYIQSRGTSQDNDYRWLKISEKNPTLKNPDFLNNSIDNISIIELIDSQYHSIILAKLSSYFCLLITGLVSKRIDFMGRQIRNSVLWVYRYDSDNEKIVRAITVKALRGELDDLVDLAISDGGDYGFQVDYEKITNLVNQVEGEPQNADPDYKIGSNSKTLKQALAEELKSKCLPSLKKDSILVVTTTFKTADALKKAHVWRGLSSKIDGDDWEIYQYNSQRQATVTGKKQFLLLLIGVVIILILFLTMKLMTPNPQPETNPTIPCPQHKLITPELQKHLKTLSEKDLKQWKQECHISKISVKELNSIYQV
jgi:hypothetical protein